MNIQTGKFIRKPVHVNAVQVTLENMDEVAIWCNGEVLEDDVTPNSNRKPKRYIHVRVLHATSVRQTRAYVGDWVLYAGTSYKSYTNTSFLKQFDKVEDPAIQAAARESLRLLANNILAMVS